MRRIKETAPNHLAISSITRMELEYGLKLNPQRAEKIRPILAEFLAGVITLPFGEAEPATAGAIRAALRRAGSPIGAYDVLIAATGLVHGLVVVTANVGEFSRVGGLNVENWRD